MRSALFSDCGSLRWPQSQAGPKTNAYHITQLKSFVYMYTSYLLFNIFLRSIYCFGQFCSVVVVVVDGVD